MITTLRETSARETLGPIADADIVKASASFSICTAVVDGFHSRLYGLLSVNGRLVVARVLLIIELLGVLPSQVDSITFAFIPKGAKGGFRAIALFASLYRL